MTPSLFCTIDLDLNPSVSFKSASGSSFVLPGPFPRARLSEMRADLGGELEEVKRLISSSRRLTMEEALAAITKLHRCTRAFALELCDDETATLIALQEFFRGAVPNWRRPVLGSGDAGRADVEVRSKIQDSIPLEILPLFDVSSPRGSVAIEAAASSFVGFATIVKRRVSDVRSVAWADERIRNNPKLHLRFFRHAALAGANEELQFFSKNDHAFEIDKVWPEEKEVDSDFGKLLATQLWSSVERVNGHLEQLQHFACHCKAIGASQANCEIRLMGTSSDGRGQRARLTDLKHAHTDLAVDSDLIPGVKPLVFLNACGSSEIDPSGVGSLPRFFLKRDHQGFIGAKTRLPDQLASKFARWFYQATLGGSSLGRSLHDTRWRMLRELNNPLGLFYAMYADPGLRVEKPRKVVL